MNKPGYSPDIRPYSIKGENRWKAYFLKYSIAYPDKGPEHPMLRKKPSGRFQNCNPSIESWTSAAEQEHKPSTWDV